MKVSQTSTPKARFWILTISYKDWKKPETIDALAGVKYLRGQLEYSASQFLHWQLVVQYFEPVSFVAVKQLFSESAHVEMTYAIASWNYVWKDETAIKETRFEIGDNSDVLNVLNRKNSRVEETHTEIQEWMDIDKLKAKLESVVESLYFLPKEGLYLLWNAANGAEQLLEAENFNVVETTPTNIITAHQLLSPPPSQILEATNKGKKWKPEDIAELKEMLLQDFTIEDIARRFKRTSKSIIAKVAPIIDKLLTSGMTMDAALKVYHNKISERDMALYYNYQTRDKWRSAKAKEAK
ncbi:hypothetical protein HDV01_004519 [Terramyces sp. JEL0728]|nr:hypothetical protein HDV01_004519 [Terramyces sp. JEL0728]